MSGVSSSSDINYYNDLAQEARRVSKETSDEKTKEIEKIQENYEKRLARTQDSHVEDIRDVEDGIEETIQEHRDNQTETAMRAKELSRREVDQMKKELYDRTGKVRDQDRSEADNRIKKIWSDAERLHESDKMRAEQQRYVFERKTEQRENDYKNLLEESVEDAKRSASESYRKAYQDESGLLTEYQRRLEDRYNSLNKDRISELNFNKEREYAFEQARADMEKQREDIQKAQSRKIEDIARHLNHKSAEEIKKQRNVFVEENNDLRKKLQKISDLRTDYQTGKSEGWQAAIKEADELRQIRDRQVQESHISRVAQLQRKLEQNRSDMGHKNVLEQEKIKKELSEMLRRENDRHSMVEKNSLRSFEFETNEIKKEADARVDHTRKLMEYQRQKAESDKNEALEVQAKTFKNDLNRGNKRAFDRIDQLETTVAHLNSTDNPNEVSQNAVQNVKEAVSRDYEKILEQERARNEKNTESLVNSNLKKLNDVIEQHEKDQRMFSQNTTLSKHKANQDRLNLMEELEFNKEREVSRQLSKHNREMKKVTTSYMGDIESRERKFQEALESLRADNEAKIQRVNDESAFKLRMAQLQFKTQYDNMARDFERKLHDQKVNLELQSEEAQKDLMAQLRQSEKEKKTQLELAERKHNEQIEQLEFQKKERERLLEQNFEDQLAKLREANARLVRS